MLPTQINPIARNKSFVRRIVRAYLTDDDGQIRVWNDATVELLDKDLNELEVIKKDVSELEEIIKELDEEVNSYNNQVENF